MKAVCMLPKQNPIQDRVLVRVDVLSICSMDALKRQQHHTKSFAFCVSMIDGKVYL